MRRIFVLFAILVMSIFSTDAFSGEVRTNFGDVNINLGGQLRPRVEVNDKSTVAGSDTDYFTSQRSRLNVGVDAGAISGFLQLQDVRNWGEETSTLEDSADGFDVHQAYVNVQDFANLPLSLKVGRQELAFDGQRLIGSVNWAQQARTFDALRINTNLGPAGVSLVAATEVEDDTADKDDEYIFMAHAKAKVNEMMGVSGILVWNNDDEVEMDRVTLGARGTLKSGPIKGRVEGYYQTGDTSATTKAKAFMVAARLGYAFDTPIKPNITLWYDYLSGDEDTADTDIKSFDTLYATNHKFYGFMDYFIAVPGNTGNKGLQDIAIKASIKPLSNVTTSAHFHYFLLAEDSATDAKKELGKEIDLTAKWKYDKHLNIVAGYSHFFNTELSRTGVASHGDEDADWAYVMMDFKF